MPKVLSRSGVSLADTYDVEGSIAGIDNLETEDVQLVHEMGGTIVSERFSATIRRRSTGAIAQNITIAEVLTDLPPNMSRITGVTVINAALTSVARLTQLGVFLRDPLAGRESLIWAWNGAVSNHVVVDDGGAAAVHEILNTEPALTLGFPTMAVGSDQRQSVGEIAMRGTTAGFGAGTIELVLLIHILFYRLGGISSFGLPMPSW